MKIAAVQMDVALAKVDANLNRMVGFLEETREKGAELTIFPECAVSGYCYESLDQARPFAHPVPGPAIDRLAEACRRTGGYCVTGMLERDGEKVFNVAVLIGPAGLIGSYRKIHLPYLGVDMLTEPGDRPFAVYEAGDVRVGLNICYDASFPESARCLALLGADLICLPTNWPTGSECVAAHSVVARALENGVYYAAVNRVGTEGGFPFIGCSSIIAPNGTILAAARGADEEILYADIDVSLARRKHVVRVAEKHEVHRFADRRPEMYSLLTKPHQLATPRQMRAR